MCEVYSHGLLRQSLLREEESLNIADWQPFNLRTSTSMSVVPKTRKKKYEDEADLEKKVIPSAAES